MRIRVGWLVLISVALGAVAAAQTTIYWRKDHIYAGPGGKEIAIVTPAPSDTTAPTAPSSLATSSLTATSVVLTWTGSTDAGGSSLAGYKIYRQRGSGANLPVGTVGAGTTTFAESHLQPLNSYNYTIVAFDNAQNHSTASNAVTLTTLAASTDTTPPDAPISASGAMTDWRTAKVQWMAGADRGGSGVAGYRVYRKPAGGVYSVVSGSSLLSVLNFTDSGLADNTTFTYAIRTVDGANNESANSNTFDVTTRLVPVFSDDFNRPDAPTLGPNWLGSNRTIVSNQASPGAAYPNYVVGNTHVEVELYTTDGQGGIDLWDGSIGQYHITWNFYAGGGTITIQYYDRGTALYTQLASQYVGGFSGSKVFTVDAQASASGVASRIKVFWGDTLAVDIQDGNSLHANSGNVWMTGYMTMDNFKLFGFSGQLP